MYDVQSKTAESMLPKNKRLFFEFNVSEYGEDTFSNDIRAVANAYNKLKSLPDLKKSRHILNELKIKPMLFSNEPSFKYFQNKVVEIYMKLFPKIAKEFPEIYQDLPDSITLEISRANANGIEHVATVDEEHSTKEHGIIKFHGTELARCIFHTFHLNGRSDLSYTEKNCRHELSHLIDQPTLIAEEKEGLKQLEKLGAPYSARKLYYLLFESLLEARATIYEFTDCRMTFTETDGEIFRKKIMEMCMQNNPKEIEMIYDNDIDRVKGNGIYKQSYIAACVFGLSYVEDKKIHNIGDNDKLHLRCLPHNIRERVRKETASMHFTEFISAYSDAFKKMELASYCPLTQGFVYNALNETLKDVPERAKDEIRKVFFDVKDFS